MQSLTQSLKQMKHRLSSEMQDKIYKYDRNPTDIQTIVKTHSSWTETQFNEFINVKNSINNVVKFSDAVIAIAKCIKDKTLNFNDKDRIYSAYTFEIEGYKSWKVAQCNNYVFADGESGTVKVLKPDDLTLVATLDLNDRLHISTFAFNGDTVVIGVRG